jgi:tetratricopeptide (TPR) repeat protein
MPLTDYRIAYRFDTEADQMTVVGHIEQLRLSRCYQKAGELTCLTCHDPHTREKPKDATAFSRRKCLDCHDRHPCGLDEAQRLKKEPNDNCVACHMLRGKTDIPHVAFTHHRIGLHPAPAGDAATPAQPATPGRVPELVPIADVSHLSPLDRDHNLGLAYLRVWRTATDPRQREVFRDRALTLLEGVHETGLREGEAAEALAELYRKQDPDRAAKYAREALALKGVSGETRALALVILADCEMQDEHFRTATELLKELVTLRRYSEDWKLLGVCYRQQNQPREAVAALQQALALRPYRPDVHGLLADLYSRLGDGGRAAEHREKARWLAEHRQE